MNDRIVKEISKIRKDILYYGHLYYFFPDYCFLEDSKFDAMVFKAYRYKELYPEEFKNALFYDDFNDFSQPGGSSSLKSMYDKSVVKRVNTFINKIKSNKDKLGEK